MCLPRADTRVRPYIARIEVRGDPAERGTAPPYRRGDCHLFDGALVLVNTVLPDNASSSGAPGSQ